MAELTVKLLQATSFGERAANINVISTVGYAPGAAVRGAIAAAWIREYGLPRSAPDDGFERFSSLFEGSHWWGPLLPEGSALEPTYVLRCKYPSSPGCHIVVIDESHGDRAGTCPACAGTLERGKGQLLGGVAIRSASVQLNEDETAKKGALFSRDYLPAGLVLKGTVGCSASELAWLEGHTIWLGARSSVAGMAEVVTVRDDGAGPPTITDGVVVVRASSPVVITDAFGRPDPYRASAALAEALDLGDDEWEDFDLAAHWIRVTRTAGWNAFAGAPKPDEWAVAPGSAWAIRVRNPGDSLDTAAAAVQQSGIGVRRNEGFGAVHINPPRWVAPASAATPVRPPPTWADVPEFDQATAKTVRSHVRLRIEALEAGDPAQPEELGRVTRTLNDEQLKWVKEQLGSKDLDNLRRVSQLLKWVPLPLAMRDAVLRRPPVTESAGVPAESQEAST